MSHHNLQKGALINGLRCWILRRLWRRENRCIRVGAFHTVGYHLAGRLVTILNLRLLYVPVSQSNSDWPFFTFYESEDNSAWTI